MNLVIHLVLRLIFEPGDGLVHISSVMTLDFSYLGTKKNLSQFFFIENRQECQCV